MIIGRMPAFERLSLGGSIAVAVPALSCGDLAVDPSLVHSRDSSRVEMVEALRPLWDDVPGWTIDPDPLVDLALSGTGLNHESSGDLAAGAAAGTVLSATASVPP